MNRKLWLGLFLLLLLAAGIGFCSRLLPQFSATRDELSWLRSNFDLEPSRMQKIEAIHLAYKPRCMEMCERVRQANTRVREMIENGPHNEAELAVAIREAGSVASDCRVSMLGYIYEVAAVMPPQDAKRFLREMAPHLAEVASEKSMEISPPSEQ